MKLLYKFVMVAFLATVTASTTLVAQSLETDSLALVDLYNECGGADWSGFDTWLNGPINTWEAVTVDSAMQRVTHVGFKNMDLVGALPESLGNMSEMSGKIEIHDDVGLTGELPSFLWKWTKMERFQVKRSGYTSIDTEGVENLVNLTEFNTEKTPIEGMIPGVFFTLPAMVKLYFHDSEFDAVPEELASSTGLDRLYLNGNHLTEIPDLSGVAWASGAKVRVHNNYLTFEDLEGNVVIEADANVEEFRYSPQAPIGIEEYSYPEAGTPVALMAEIGGTANVYTWIRGVDEVVGDASTYEIDAFDADAHSGNYFAVVQNTLVPGLDITVANQKLFASEQAQDSLALVALYNQNNGENWVGFDTWLNGPISTWEQVTIDSASQRVSNVVFKDMDLTGSLAPELADITEMGGKIEFRNDSLLTGELPSFLWKWTNVERFQVKFSGYTSIDTDGLENMVNLTEFNTEGTPIDGMIPGVLFTLPNMEKLYFHDCEFDQFPPELAQATKLDRLYINGDNFTEIPDMSGMTWGSGAKIRLHENFLTFEDLEPNVVIEADTNVAELRYSPQANVGMETSLDLAPGDTLSLAVEVGGSANIYSWIKGADEVVGEEASYQVDSVGADDAGDYMLLVQSSLVPGLDIFSELYTVTIGGATGIDEQYFGDIRVLGNPVGDDLRIEADEMIERINIYNVGGQEIHQELVQSKYISIPVGHFSPGIYFVTLRAGQKYRTIKISKHQ